MPIPIHTPLSKAGKPLPIDITDSIFYFVGPTPAKAGQAIGSAGPTTSYRMDAYSPALIEKGQIGMIGKGKRNQGTANAKSAGRKLKRINGKPARNAGCLLKAFATV